MLAYFSFQFFLLMKDFHNNLLIFLLVFLCWLGNNFLLFPFNFLFFFFFHQSNLPTYFEKLFLSKKYIFLQTGKKVADKTGFLFRLKIKINCINLISYSFVINEQSPISSISFLSSKQDKKVYQFNNFCIVIFCLFPISNQNHQPNIFKISLSYYSVPVSLFHNFSVSFFLSSDVHQSHHFHGCHAIDINPLYISFLYTLH